MSLCKTVTRLKGLLSCLRYLKSVYKSGGFTPYQITTIQPSELLKGKKILITGGSAGIGYAIAKRCIQEKAEVVITGRNAKRLAGACASIDSNSIHALVWDVADTLSREQNLDKATELLQGNLDILVNNAAVLLRQSFLNVTESNWDETYKINSRGLFFLTQSVCDRWLSKPTQRVRKILNISSQGAYVGATYPYRMTKWDIAGLTQGLGLKLAKHGILVNGIAPGIVATEIQPDCFNRTENIYYKDNPINRFALPEEIADLAIFMLSNASNFLTGQTIVCDGGYSIK